MAEEATTPLLASELFIDEDFPAGDESLFEDGKRPIGSRVVGWKRPQEIAGNPQMFVEGASRADVCQGDLGDCWFLSACSAVAQGKHVKTRFNDELQGAFVLTSYSDDECQDLIARVIPEGQVLQGDNYSGKVTFYFWHMGQWKKTEIDDRLPVDKDGKLVYAKCSDENEFWLPLLEKAFAKFHGNYYRLDGGYMEKGLLYLTGGAVKPLDLKQSSVFRTMTDDFHEGSLILCGSNLTGGRNRSIYPMHCYTVTGLASFMQESQRIRLLRVRNPWGRKEWTGDWSDIDTDNWGKIYSDLQNLLLDSRDTNDGEAWMEFKDFVDHFQEVTVARILPEADGLKLCTSIGSWEKYGNVSGSQEDLKSLSRSPQYLLRVINPDNYIRYPGDDDDNDEEIEKKKDKCRVTIELIHEQNHSNFRSGLAIYKTSDPSKRPRAAEELTEKIGSETVSENISVLRQELLERGDYIIIPYFQEPDLSHKFFIRVQSTEPIGLEELKDTEEDEETWWEYILRCKCFSCKTEDIRVNITLAGTANL